MHSYAQIKYIRSSMYIKRHKNCPIIREIYACEQVTIHEG